MDHKDIDPQRVFVAGHSLGATVAPYIAAKEPRIAGLIMLAAAARPIYALVEEQVAYLAGLDGKIDEQEQARLKEIRQSAKALREGAWKPGDRLLGASVEYWASLDKTRPAANAKALTIPVLLAQGGRDYQVCPERDFGIWQRELAGRDNVTLKLFKAMDHLFRRGEGPSTPEQYKERGHVDKSVIEYLAQWIRGKK
jgi:pimeloyl-ACP methyl ester carboxylesterase